MKKYIYPLFLLVGYNLYAQEKYTGKIVDEHNQPLVGAEVFWEGSTQSTITDEEGNFSITKEVGKKIGVFYENEEQLFLLPSDSSTMITFRSQSLSTDINQLKEVTITDRRPSLRQVNSPFNAMQMTRKELLKAACCNLAESFETNPSIDVNFSDAVTGNKQIKMLGLTSPYILVAEENIPSVRGASQAYGLSFTPGTWIENILVTKGMGPVLNGYESISGQINTELIKPRNDIPFFLNLYGSTDARIETNAHYNHHFNEKWSSSLFLHGNSRLVKNDHNNDGFLDNPLGEQINVMNRWQYQNIEKGWVGFASARYMKDDKWGGEKDFKPSLGSLQKDLWGYQIKTERLDLNAKVGYVFPEMPFQSMGLQFAYSDHDQNSYFGNRWYDINQKSFYANYIFQSIINNTKNKFSLGSSFTWDQYRENLALSEAMKEHRIDNSAGIFAEYHYDNLTNFSLIAGGRIDYHNRMGVFATPRLHLRYNPWKDTTIKASVGRGKRLANIFAENQNLMASNRAFMIATEHGNFEDLNPEIAWNFGGSIAQKFRLFNRNADLSVDFYRTAFENQIVTDIDSSSHQVLFYNLNGKSFANSMQVDFNFQPINHLQLRTSYKYYDIQTDYLSGRMNQALQAKNRFFANAEFTTHETENGAHWRFDLTYNWFSKQRLPSSQDNAINNQWAAFSNPYSTLNAQITRVFSKTFEVYVGGENLTDYQQKRVIYGGDNPFGQDFDSSMVYAPIFGRMIYAGLRFKVL